MNRIEKAFSKGKAFIGYITAGDPDIVMTGRLICEMAENGADIVEVGIPFSDPTAEGDVIYNANMRALENNTTVGDVFASIRAARNQTDAAVVLLTYINPVFVYGYDKFFSECKDAGIDGIVIPDLPFEERDEIEEYAENYGIYVIALVAPTSKERIEKIVKDAKGFIYLVSSLGVTGVRDSINYNLNEIVEKIRLYTDTPVAVGFGISGPEQANEISKICDGVIVGSAIVKIIEDNKRNLLSSVGNFVKELKESIK